MAKVKILLTETPKCVEDCPFCTNDEWDCILHLGGYECHCNNGKFDFSKCPYCQVLKTK